MTCFISRSGRQTLHQHFITDWGAGTQHLIQYVPIESFSREVTARPWSSFYSPPINRWCPHVALRELDPRFQQESMKSNNNSLVMNSTSPEYDQLEVKTYIGTNFKLILNTTGGVLIAPKKVKYSFTDNLMYAIVIWLQLCQ